MIDDKLFHDPAFMKVNVRMHYVALQHYNAVMHMTTMNCFQLMCLERDRER